LVQLIHGLLIKIVFLWSYLADFLGSVVVVMGEYDLEDIGSWFGTPRGVVFLCYWYKELSIFCKF